MKVRLRKLGKGMPRTRSSRHNPTVKNTFTTWMSHLMMAKLQMLARLVRRCGIVNNWMEYRMAKEAVVPVTRLTILKRKSTIPGIRDDEILMSLVPL